MPYAEIAAKLIRWTFETVHLATSERVVIQRYPPEQASAIVQQLLPPAATTTVVIHNDDGRPTPRSLRCLPLQLEGRTVQLLPFVVYPHGLSADSEPWEGTQGFASRLRDNFHFGTPANTVRVLLLFDQHPVETERTTSSAEFAAVLDSLEPLRVWLDSPEWKTGFEPSTHALARSVIDWWTKRVLSHPEWARGQHAQLLERAVDFMQACRVQASPEGVGGALPLLGLLFQAPNLTSSARPTSADENRLNANADLAQRFEEFRVQRVIDPVTLATKLLDLGKPGEAFHDALMERFRSLSGLITQADVTYEDVQSRLREHAHEPAQLDVGALKIFAVNDSGRVEGPPLLWQPLGGRPAEAEEVDLVVASPTGRIQLTAPVNGNQPGWLYLVGRDGRSMEIRRVEPRGELAPIQLDGADPTLEVHELQVRAQQLKKGRPPAPTQRIRIAVQRGERCAAPEGATLDPKQKAFVVDGTADSIKVRIGNTEHQLSDEDLPPGDGSSCDVEIDGVTFRWRGQDRPPEEKRPSGSRLRLLEQLALLQTGEPTHFEPIYTFSGGLAAAAAGALQELDISRESLEAEASLLLHPEQFIGGESDAALENLRRSVPAPLEDWLQARRTFFAAVVALRARGPREREQPSPSLYLANLRTAQLGALAEKYVESYCALLKALTAQVQTGSNQALVEPVLFCDRTREGSDYLSLAPTHPVAVALLAALQNGLLSTPYPDKADRKALVRLLEKPLLAGVLPWIPWRGRVLSCAQESPLLCRHYGTSGGSSVDTDNELAGVLEAKVKRLLELCPHLNEPTQFVYLNIDLGNSAGEYVVRALEHLVDDKKIHCQFDIATAGNESTSFALPELFTGRPTETTAKRRAALQGRVRVARQKRVAQRAAHLVLRVAGPEAVTTPFSNISSDHQLLRDTGFAAGLLEEPIRIAQSEINEVRYTQYVTSGPWAGESTREGLWGGLWRQRYNCLVALTRNLAVGLQASVSSRQVPCRHLRQLSHVNDTAEYARAFITVHCDPAQGPEFFVGTRAARAGVFLIECSDRGQPDLPGRDIVSVTSHITPFRSALKTALQLLPASLRDHVDDEVAKGLLRDINVLRGTRVFDFMRVAARQDNHVGYMAGLDNVLALRLLLAPDGQPLGDYLPVVIALHDFTARSPALESLERGIRCDDILVLYLPRADSEPRPLLYRLVEVKFGFRKSEWEKARQQLAETASKLRVILPTGKWSNDSRPMTLLLERDLAWIIHEALERYRAFGVLTDDHATESHWGLKALFARLHRGEFELNPYRANSGSDAPLNGTALMLDPHIPGEQIERDLEHDTEYVTVPFARLEQLLLSATSGPTHTPRPGGSSGAGAPRGSSAAESVAESTETVAESTETPLVPAAPSHAVRSSNVTESEPQEAHIEQAFAHFIGNAGALKRIKQSLRYQLKAGNRWLDPTALFGPRSTGKTEVARRVARALGVPRLELSEAQLTSPDDLASRMRDTAQKAGTPFMYDETGLEVAPPMVVFIDEVHLLKARVQDSLLTATEPNDRILRYSAGSISTRNVTFLVATTDPGRLRTAFNSRFVRLELQEYTLEEVVEILKAHRAATDQLPPETRQLDDEALRVVSTVGRLVPRQALLYLREVGMALSLGEVRPDSADLWRYFRETLTTDEQGLTERDRRYLHLLFPDRLVGLEALATMLGEDPTTVEQEFEPYLLRLKLIVRERAGRKLTEQGRAYVARQTTIRR